ncbi:MAG: RNA polymerase factor sigma-54 [Rubrimonas sp.]
MQFGQTLSQRQTLQMGASMLNSLAILGMSAQELSDHLNALAQTNPFVSYRPPPAFAARGGEEFDVVAALATHRPSLMAHVVAQIELAFSAPADRMIALRFAEALEPSGWLGQPVEMIALTAGVSQERAERVLAALQGFEPTGLFARTLSECLTLQALEADALTWEVETLLENLHLVGEGRMVELAELCDCDPGDLPELLAQLRRFDPKPGLAYEHVAPPAFPPDLIASRTAEGWAVELNRAVTPTIAVREDRLADGGVDRAARRERRKALAEARALALALDRRGDTLLRAAAVLVARQSAFLDRGVAFLAPLSLEDVAAELGLHASTVSRSLAGRMIQTPTRTLPLRAFFSRGVGGGAAGEGVSRDSALEFVRETVRGEDPANPLSDDAIVLRAERAGLAIARRTVAKYRAALGLGSSYVRRRRPTPP